MSFDCVGCDESTREAWGCVKPVEIPIWEDDEDALHNCPASFIAPCVADFLNRYNAIKNGWAAPQKYEDYPNRFVEYIKLFESCLSKALKMKQPKDTENG
jgi:hypothetical protein